MRGGRHQPLLVPEARPPAQRQPSPPVALECSGPSLGYMCPRNWGPASPLGLYGYPAVRLRGGACTLEPAETPIYPTPTHRRLSSSRGPGPLPRAAGRAREQPGHARRPSAALPGCPGARATPCMYLASGCCGTRCVSVMPVGVHAHMCGRVEGAACAGRVCVGVR